MNKTDYIKKYIEEQTILFFDRWHREILEVLYSPHREKLKIGNTVHSAYIQNHNSLKTTYNSIRDILDNK